jgi:hypothetical protein
MRGTIAPVRRRELSYLRPAAASLKELRESPSLVASSFSLGSFSPGPTWPERIIRFIPVMASSVRAKMLLQYDCGMRPNRWQRYLRVAVHHVEVHRLDPWHEIHPFDRSPVRENIDA